VTEPNSWRRQVWRQHAANSALEAAAAAADPSGLLAALAPETPPVDTFRRLRHLLETYTDVTRYPRCGWYMHSLFRHLGGIFYPFSIFLGVIALRERWVHYIYTMTLSNLCVRWGSDMQACAAGRRGACGSAA
jgi:hypothetical protein